MQMNDFDWFLITHYTIAFVVISYFAVRAQRAEAELEHRKNRRL
jgi:hypothetical protein